MTTTEPTSASNERWVGVPAPIRELTARVHAAVVAGVGDMAPTTMTIPESSRRGLAAGLTDVVLGRNEIGCQAAHRQIFADLAADSGTKET